MAPGFYLKGTKMVVSHSLDLDLLKRINDLDFVVSIKGSPYSAVSIRVTDPCVQVSIEPSLNLYPVSKGSFPNIGLVNLSNSPKVEQNSLLTCARRNEWSILMILKLSN